MMAAFVSTLWLAGSLAVALLSWPGAPSARPYEDQDCLVTEAMLETILDESAPGVVSAEPAYIDEETGHLVHRVALADGTDLSFTEGGCVHYSMDLLWIGAPDSLPADDDPALFTVLRQKVEAAPIAAPHKERLVLAMLAALEQAANSPESWAAEGQLFGQMPESGATVSFHREQDGFSLHYQYPL